LSTPLWQPSQAQIDGAEMTRFRKRVETDWGVELPDSRALWKFSVTELEKFWTSVWEDAGIIAETRGERVLADGDKMPGAKWFPDARLSFAENLLRHRGDGEAMVFNGEVRVSRRLSFDDVYDQVSVMVQILEAFGVGEGDRVCGYLPNMPETVIAMAANSFFIVSSSTVRRSNARDAAGSSERRRADVFARAERPPSPPPELPVSRLMMLAVLP